MPTARKKKNKLLLLTVFICTMYLFADGQETSECDVWTSTMDAIKNLGELNPSCRHNSFCTGFDCTGSSGSVKISFGGEFYTCSHPVQLRVYAASLGQEEDRVINITEKQQVVQVPIGGNISGLYHATVRITVQLVSPQNISFQMNAYVEVASLHRNIVLVPLVYIRVPDCDYLSRRMNGVTATTPPTPSPTISYTGTECKGKETVLDACEIYQKCVGGSCACIQGYRWDGKTKECIEDAAATTSSGGIQLSTTGIIIMVVCILAAILFAGILTVIAVKYRRYRRRYGQHEPLINNEGDDRDLEVDNDDPPMLDG